MIKFENLVEYGVYHDCINKTKSLHNFSKGKFNFFSKSKNNKKFIFQEFKDILDNTIKKNLQKINSNSILLCSGGVDSSILALRLNELNKKFTCYHSYYPKHKINDLDKIKSLNKFTKLNLKYFYINQEKFLVGIKESWKNKYFGNTYAPCLYYMFKKKLNHNYRYIITGTCPDELFYGMEKYSLKLFDELKDEKIDHALSILDVKYNYDNYFQILNQFGKNLLNQVLLKRKKLYKNISSISNNLINAQRLLAYATVTNQHMEMFDKLAKNKRMKHIAPFYDKEFINYCFSISLENFFYMKSKKKDANVGKYQLKKILSQDTSIKHAFFNKTGFYSPVSSFLKNDRMTKYFLNKLNYEKLEILFNVDKLKKKIKSNISRKNYFIYSLINLNEKLKD